MDKQREKLIELIEKGQTEYYNSFGSNGIRHNEYVADCLLANGVIVPPCKVGQTVYELDYDFESESLEVVQSSVRGFEVSTTYNFHHLEDCHETLFLSREEAERALEERKEK